ncbi:MAG: hypothetical protein JJ974_03010 [Phycisphaerales bacterium]|nr:hypothetical protein [Phycisphaerales bacterium]
MKKHIVSTVIVLGVFVVGIWILQGRGLFKAQPLSASEVELLNPDWDLATNGNWSPWQTTADGSKEWNPTAGFNAWIETIPEQERAWPIIARVSLDHEELHTHEWLSAKPDENEDWETTSRLLMTSASQHAVDELVQAMRRPWLGIVDREGTDPVMHQLMLDRGLEDIEWVEEPDLNPDPWVNITSYFADLRTVSSVLATAAYAALESDLDSERYMQILSAMFDGADLALTRTRLIDHLVYVAMYQNAIGVLDWGLVNHAELFGEDNLAELDRVLQEYGPRPLEVTDEILVLHDHFRRLVNTRGKLDIKRASNDDWWIPDFTAPSHKPIEALDPRIHRILLYQSRQFNMVARKSSLPWDGEGIAFDDFREGFESVPKRMRDKVSESEFVISYWERNLELQTKVRALRFAIALERHQRRNGAYPDRLEDVEVDLINFDITDPFTGDPLLYALSDDGPVVYSTGADRDDDLMTLMRDRYLDPNYAQSRYPYIRGNSDGGISMKPHWISSEHAEGIEDQSQIDGDWVLFPEPDYSGD